MALRWSVLSTSAVQERDAPSRVPSLGMEYSTSVLNDQEVKLTARAFQSRCWPKYVYGSTMRQVKPIVRTLLDDHGANPRTSHPQTPANMSPRAERGGLEPLVALRTAPQLRASISGSLAQPATVLDSSLRSERRRWPPWRLPLARGVSRRWTRVGTRAVTILLDRVTFDSSKTYGGSA